MKTNYPWHHAPEWAQFAATDADGLRYWHQERPSIDVNNDEWVPPYPANFKLITVDRSPLGCPHWRDTLEERPIECADAGI
jgi:hypothetical protein